MKYRQFNKHDWDCFAGAATFDTGEEPLIAESEDGLVSVLADNTAIVMLGAQGEETWRREYTLEHKRYEAELVLTSLQPASESLIAHGFIEVAV